MENSLSLAAFRCWNAHLKPFLVASLLGILAGACFSGLARAAPGPASASATTGLSESATASQHVAAAGRIRQHAERLAKLYQQIGMGLDSEKAWRQIEASRRQIDAELAGLRRTGLTEKTAALIERLGQGWEELKRDTAPPYSPQNRQNVFIQADALAMMSGKLATQFELHTSAPTARLLDLALRQNMLAQRLARFYLMAYAGDKTAGLLVDIEQARREFSSALNELIGAGENTESNRRTLELARVQWVFFEQSIFGMKDRNTANPMTVATSSERILEVLDDLSMQYANAITSNSSAKKRDNS